MDNVKKIKIHILGRVIIMEVAKRLAGLKKY